MKSITSQNLDQNYTLTKKLGQGTFASVNQIINNITNQHFAVKQIYVQKPYLDDVKTEVSRIKQIQTDNVIKIIEYFYDEDQFYFNIVMQLCKGSLRTQIEQRTVFDEDRLLSFIIQITSAFLALQDNKIMHLDLKPQNILFANQQGTYFKICDFGCSQISNISRLSGYQNCVFGTFNYLAPQIFLNYQGQKTRTSADIWSFGIILYQMIFWRYPFPKKDEKFIVDRDLATNFFQNKGYQINYSAIEGSPFKIIEIIKLMLVAEPTKRINWKDLRDYLIKNFKVQQHEFMNIQEVIINFIHIIQLYLKVVGLIGKNSSTSTHIFWKSNSKFIRQFRQTLIYYCYIICENFNKINQVKHSLIPTVNQQKTDNLLELLVNERQKCSAKVKEFESKDLCWRQTQLYDQLKVCLGKISSFKGNMESSLILLQTFCLQLSDIIQKDKGLFADLKYFEKSFKIKF